MAEEYVANCAQSSCGFSIRTPDRAEAVEGLVEHTRDHHQGMTHEEADRRVVRAPPPVPGTPVRQLR